MPTFDPEPGEVDSAEQESPAEELTRAQGAGAINEVTAEAGFEGPVDPR